VWPVQFLKPVIQVVSNAVQVNINLNLGKEIVCRVSPESGTTIRKVCQSMIALIAMLVHFRRPMQLHLMLVVMLVHPVLQVVLLGRVKEAIAKTVWKEQHLLRELPIVLTARPVRTTKTKARRDVYLVYLVNFKSLKHKTIATSVVLDSFPTILN
jgi:hypothetical protein